MIRTVYTRVVIDMDTLLVTECDSYPYDGPWDLAKGGNSQAEMNQANQISAQQLAMQQQQLAQANPSLQAIIQNGGMLPAQQAAMTSQAINGLGSQYQNLYGQLSQSLAARGITGGQNAGAGQLAQSFGQLGAQEAGQQSQLLNQIQLAKGQGLQSAIGQSLGEASSTGALGLSALGSGVTAANNTDQAQTGFWGSLVGGLAGLGSAGILKCWVAAELYGGWFAPETVTIRAWLYSTWYMIPFCWAYSLLGQRWAGLIGRRPTLRRFTKMLFDLFLRMAHE
jgi:hypothetical protein